MIEEMAVVVSSCDKYSDVWTPFTTLFFRYWPDCPYPIYLIANALSWPDGRIETIAIQPDRGWATNCRLAVQQISSPYILYLQEDYLLNENVDTAQIESLLAYLDERRGACLRLYPAPPPDRPCPGHPRIGEIRKGVRYRANTQATIWDRRVLLALLRDGETGSEFEVLGSRRSDELDQPFLGVWEPALPYYCTAIVGGVWVRGAVDLCKREGIELDLTQRSVESRALELWRTRIAQPLDRISIHNVGLGKFLARRVPLKMRARLQKIKWLG